MRLTIGIVAMALAPIAFGTGCSKQTAAMDSVPLGSDVEVTRTDGAFVEAKLLERDATTVKLDVGPMTATLPRSEIVDLRAKAPTAALPEGARFREIMVQEDTKLVIRLDTALSSAASAPDTAIRGALAEPVEVHGLMALPAGSEVAGVVTHAQPSGKPKGPASLAIAFNRITVAGEHYPMNAKFESTATSTNTKDADVVLASGTVLTLEAGRLLTLHLPLAKP